MQEYKYATCFAAVHWSRKLSCHFHLPQQCYLSIHVYFICVLFQATRRAVTTSHLYITHLARAPITKMQFGYCSCMQLVAELLMLFAVAPTEAMFETDLPGDTEGAWPNIDDSFNTYSSILSRHQIPERMFRLYDRKKAGLLSDRATFRTYFSLGKLQLSFSTREQSVLQHCYYWLSA